MRNGEVREPGFTPVPNLRIDAAIVAEIVELEEAGVPAHEAVMLAFIHVGRRLPAPAIGRRHRAPTPSKSDNPGYRKPNLRKCLRAAA